MPIATVNPATGETLRSFDALSKGEVDNRLGKAVAAFETHRLSSFETRAKCMRRAGEILVAEKERLGKLMTVEMGKPLTAAIAEAEKCATACFYYADNAEALLSDYAVSASGNARVYFQPLGVILAVMPWNFPLWQVFRFLAPSLMAGNVGLLKHSSNVPQCALAVEDIVKRAGFDEGVFQTLLIGSEEVASIIADPRVAAVTLTGSEGAGRSVGEAAGRSLKKAVLELGGSDPFIVMQSADIDSAAKTAVTARMINNGQSCIAAKRFIVHDTVYDDFVDRFVRGVKAVRIGDPMDPGTELGPLATEAIRDELAEQVRKTVSMGARVLCGGQPIDRTGFYYAPTVLADIPEQSPADEEELFGPVASVWRASSIDDAIGIANSTRFGLGASAWTQDAGERERFIRDIQAGMVFINGMVASEAALPFGGVKASGYGRELGEFGIREFVNIKSVKEPSHENRRSSTE
ncbi:MAG TPA: NAD-dependent succinate-semialdehyde dehydrogenase [Gemmatimonadaceae bacterium]|nr:NAD-dependent succinate-semialdehyde dehydrogenase [Gemmatimonadaceae bacterium]